MNVNELVNKEEKLKYLEKLLISYNNNDKSVYPLILTETHHSPLNYFMIEKAVNELEEKINAYKKELNSNEIFVDKNADVKSK